MKRSGKIGVMLLLAGLLAGCIASRDPAELARDNRDWGMSAVVAELSDDDPAEGFNRVVFEIQHGFMFYLVQPIGTVYASIFPRFFTNGLRNVADNLEYPRRLFATSLQGEWGEAGMESARFFTNTTLGVAGFFDVSERFFGWHREDEDFGQVFEYWGMAPGATLLLPMANGVSVRDVCGTIFDYALDGKTYIPYAGSVNTVNSTVAQYRSFIRLMDSNSDPYEVYKSFRVIQRHLKSLDWQEQQRRQLDGMRQVRATGELPQVEPVEPEVKPDWMRGNFVTMADYGAEHPKLDMLRAVLCTPQSDESSFWGHLSLWNTDFTNLGKVRKIEVLPGRPAMKYIFWPQKQNPQAPLVMLVPGVGGHYSSPMATALAEVFFYNGYQVAVVGNPMNWQFIESASTVRFQGITSLDAVDLRRALVRVKEDVTVFLETSPEKIHLTGYSLGGLLTLHVADLEDKENLLGISRYVALNPPVDLRYTITVIDSLGESVRKWTLDEALEYAPEALGQYFAVSARIHPFYDRAKNIEGTYRMYPQYYRIPVSLTQADFLASLSFKMALRDVLYMRIREEKTIPGLKTPYQWSNRTALYREIDDINFSEYLNRFVQKEQQKSVDELFASSGLAGIESTLRNNPDIRIIHSLDDFLNGPKEQQYLDSLLQERIYWYPHGSHLGNLYFVSYHQLLLDLLK